MSKTRRKSPPAQSIQAPNPPATARNLNLAVGFGLVLLTLIVYAQAGHFDFTYYDDPDYVTKNAHVQAGLTLENIKWAFTSTVSGNWAPVTMLSHIAAYSLFPGESGAHHLINVLFHALAALFLFLALQRATHSTWPAAFTAFVFALHPLHVESVAWVAERKDVLSAFFWFLALYAYVRYTEAPDVRRYLLVVLPFCLGLMSKTMLVTFPFTLLLFDFWPLRRANFLKLVLEKVPLFLLTLAASIITYLTQSTVGAVSPVPLATRLENTPISYVVYIGQMFWPVKLAVFYPYPDSIALLPALAALAVLLILTALAIFFWRKYPCGITGWFWYLGTLVPVIGLVQVGAQSHADRYTYIPMVGLSIILAWGAVDVARAWPRTRSAIVAAAAVACLACVVLTWRQAGYWENGIILFQHADDIIEGNFPAKYQLSLEYNLRGRDLLERGRRDEAIVQFENALRVRPNWAEVHNNLGIQFANLGRAAEAIAQFDTAVRLDPDLAQAQRNLGMTLAVVPGRASEAIAHLEIAQRLQPDPVVLALLNRLRAGQK